MANDALSEYLMRLGLGGASYGVDPANPPLPPGDYPRVPRVLTPYGGTAPQTAPPPAMTPPAVPPLAVPPPERREIGEALANVVRGPMAGRIGIGPRIQGPGMSFGGGGPSPAVVGAGRAGGIPQGAPPLGGRAVAPPPPSGAQAAEGPRPTGYAGRDIPGRVRRPVPRPKPKPRAEEIEAPRAEGARTAAETDIGSSLARAAQGVKMMEPPTQQRIDSPPPPKPTPVSGDLLRILLGLERATPGNRLQELSLSRILQGGR